MDQIAITRTVTAAAGPFAAGPLGELTRLAPFEMADEVLATTLRTQQRPVVAGPGRGVPAAGLFADRGSRQVRAKLVAGLHGLPAPAPSMSALRQARQRLGPFPPHGSSVNSCTISASPDVAGSLCG
ncbi:transposase domain-containing protein [Micromonospora pisi]|uniref:transposase domain-containing protein n=1 Tax=Micromonospora pisi TaxID=589240 RepID=UPI0011C3FCDF